MLFSKMIYVLFFVELYANPISKNLDEKDVNVRNSKRRTKSEST
jgi:hypothetical protein